MYIKLYLIYNVKLCACDKKGQADSHLVSIHAIS